ncbi:MAG: hypothetical protein AAFX06_02940 [Planctomycetota bacterium]
MTASTKKNPKATRGTVLMEVVVAAALVVTVLAIATPLVFQTSRIWKQTQQYQLALDELNGQMDRLLTLSGEEREAAMESIEVSESIATVLEQPELTANVLADSSGQRIELGIDWNRIGDPPPVTLVAWIDALPPSDETPEKATR